MMLRKTLAALLAVGVFATVGQASIITISSTMPSVSGPDIASTGGTSTEKWFAGSGASNGLGQTFLTGSDSGGYNLVSYSLQVATTSQSNVGAMSFTLRLGTLSGTTFTPIATTTGLSKPANMAWASGDWFTFTFDTPVALSASSTYAVDIEMNSAGDWHGGIPYMYYNGSNVYAGGLKYSFASATSTTVGLDSNRDRNFVIDLETAAVPEPATLGLLAIGGLMMIQRRKHA